MTRILSIDGGGTKLTGILLDENLTILGRGRAGGVNLTQTTLEDCRANVRSCLDELFSREKPDHVDVVYAVFVGPVQELTDELNRRVRVDRFVRCDEKAAGLLAGNLKMHGLLALAGTGAGVSWVKADGSRESVGYLGPVFGDQGSGPWMGLQAVRAVSRAVNGWGEPTMLLSLIQEEWQAESVTDMVRILKRHPAPYRMLGELTPLIGRACDAGDAVARSIVTAAGHVLAVQTDSLLRRIAPEDPGPVITLCGGAWKTHRLMYETYCREVGETRPALSAQMPLFEHVCAGPATWLFSRGCSRQETLRIMRERLPMYCIRAGGLSEEE